MFMAYFNPLKTKRRLFYLKTQSVQHYTQLRIQIIVIACYMLVVRKTNWIVDSVLWWIRNKNSKVCKSTPQNSTPAEGVV